MPTRKQDAKAASEPTREEFTEWVHDVLSRLYDSSFLRQHPLGQLLSHDEERSPERAQRLRRLMLDAIRDLRPAPGVPADSPDWRGYRILELRYVEVQPPAEAMNELALGRSQFFREQRQVIQLLADRLWPTWQSRYADDVSTGVAGESRDELFSDAVEQLVAQATWEMLDPAQLLAELTPLVNALAKAENAAIWINSRSIDRPVEADRVLLRQAMLDILSDALRAAKRGRVEVGCFATEDATGMQIDIAPQGSTRCGLGEVGSDVARRLVAAMGGSLRITRLARGGWRVQIAWLAGNPILLVVDDNEEFADLYRRYLAGRSWRIVGVPSGREALARLNHIRPAVILLDVLMPSEDGWELLVSLKEDEETRDIPVIVCSVLDQQELATGLGAAGYLNKPVTQRELVRALAPWRRPSQPSKTIAEPANRA